MDIQFKAIGVTHHNAPLEVRESLALSEQECKDFIMRLKDVTDLSDILVLSTCNRTEIYYSSNDTSSEELIKHLLIFKGIENKESLHHYFTFYRNNELAVEHLFEVCLGLDAKVVGDIQISNQVKRAYQWSADAQAAGPFLHRLMHTIFYANKKVAYETEFRSGAASVAYVASGLVERLCENIIDPKVLLVGLGEIGLDTIKNLRKSFPGSITVSNRTYEKARNISSSLTCDILPFEEINKNLENYDVIICSVAANEFTFKKEHINSIQKQGLTYFIDLSVPRSIEQTEKAGVEIYNIDDLQEKADEALEKRKSSIPEVRKIMFESILEFNKWSKEMMVSPSIQKFKSLLEQIRKEEMERFVKDLDEEQKKMLNQITQNMVQKIIKYPVVQLKAACKRGDQEDLIEGLHDLFNLEKLQELNKS